MLVKITSKRQVTFPVKVLNAMGVRAGDRLLIEESPDGFLLRPQRVDLTRLGPLKGFAEGKPPLDMTTFRKQPHDPALRN